jgi:hypothetical protein
MDGEQFDDILRRFCTTRITRVDTLRGLVAGAAAALTGSALVSDDADAKKGGKGRGHKDKNHGRDDKGKAQAEGKKGKKKGKKGKGKNKGKNKGNGGGGGGTNQPTRATARTTTCSVPSSQTLVKGNVNACPDGSGGFAVNITSGCQTFTGPGGCKLEACVTDGKLSVHPVAGSLACTFTTLVVKGGPDAIVYTFNTPTSCAENLAPPANCGQGTGQCGFSHAFICGVAACVPRTCGDLGSGKCGTNVDDLCNGTITCGCNDDDICTTDTCSTQVSGEIGTCNYTPVDCGDGDACTVDTCDPQTGCVHTPVNCDDDDVCTIDSCDPATGCVYTPVNCDDGDACTVDSCDPITGCQYTPVNCDDDDACTVDTCDPATGCVYTPVNCDDGDACTVDSCDPATGCVYTPVNCDDSNACTVDTCDPATGCVYTPVNCDDGDACTVDTCDPATGCVHTPVVCPDKPGCENLGCSEGQCRYHCFQGCTPGYFKNHPEVFAPAGYSSSQRLDSVFSFPGCLSTCNLGSKSLLAALSFSGGNTLCGAAQNLLRAAVAALLNAALVDYPLNTAQVIAEVNTALATCDRSAILAEATRLDTLNNSKDVNGNHNCPCNNKGCPARS